MRNNSRTGTGAPPSISALQRHMLQPITPISEEHKPSLAESFTPRGNLVMCYSQTDLKNHVNTETTETLPVAKDRP